MSNEIPKMEQCQNCEKMIPEEKIDTHFAYCRRNIKKCDKCERMYDINEKEEHDQQFHTTKKCEYCHQQFLESAFKNHDGQCMRKPKRCEYCDLGVPLLQFQQHFKACEARTSVCERCGKNIQNKDYYMHISMCQGINIADSPQEIQKQVRPQRRKAPVGGSILFEQNSVKKRKNFTAEMIELSNRSFNQNFSSNKRPGRGVKVTEIENNKKAAQNVIQINDDEDKATLKPESRNNKQIQKEQPQRERKSSRQRSSKLQKPSDLE